MRNPRKEKLLVRRNSRRMRENPPVEEKIEGSRRRLADADRRVGVRPMSTQGLRDGPWLPAAVVVLSHRQL